MSRDDRLMTPKEVAATFRVDPKTVGRWATSGRIPAIRTIGGHHRFHESIVNALKRGEDPWEAEAKRLRALDPD